MGQRHGGDAKQRRTAERNLLCVRHQAYIDLSLALRFLLGGVLQFLGAVYCGAPSTNARISSGKIQNVVQ